MGLHTRSGRPVIDAPIRWSLRKAGTEFGISETTLKSGLKKHGISPGPDQRFSTRQIALAVFDPDRLDAAAKEAKARKLEYEAQKAEMEMLELRGILVRTTTLDEWLPEFFAQIAQMIRHMPHADTEQREKMLKFVHEYKLDPRKRARPTSARNGSEPVKGRSHEPGRNNKLIPFDDRS